MPLPLIIGIGAAIAGAAGVGAGIHGGIKMKEASDTAKAAERRNEQNIARCKDSEKKTTQTMDNLGKYEMEIISTFERFSTAFEKIKNRPNFNEIKLDNYTPPKCSFGDIKNASVGANILLGGLEGAALGTAAGVAAGGGTTAAVMALGTASTGTAISTLSGAAATNAVLAALGGGSLAAGGGGMALGSAILGGATLGAGLLLGGIIFSIAGSSVSDKADKAWSEMKKNERKIDSICDYLGRLENIAKSFHSALLGLNDVYMNHLVRLESIIEEQKKKEFFLKRLFSERVDYNKFSNEQKRVLANTALLVGLVYDMCKVPLLDLKKKTINNGELKEINENNVINAINKSKEGLLKINSVA